MVITTLKSRNASLCFKNEWNNWCRIYLTKDKEIFLGAENFSTIKEKLLNYLKGTDIKKKLAGNYNEIPVMWIVTLSETHNTIYGAISQENSNLKMFIQDKDAHFFATVDLSENDVKNWIAELEKTKANIP